MANLSFARIMFGSAREMRGEDSSIPHAPLTSAPAEDGGNVRPSLSDFPGAIGTGTSATTTPQTSRR